MNEGQSIEEFFNLSFSQITQDKKSQWIKCLADEGYDSVQELQSSSEQAWSKLSLKLQSNVVEDIREKLRSVSNEKIEVFETESIIASNKQNLIVQLDQKRISELIDEGFPPQKIIKLMNAELGTPNGNAVLEKIRSLIEPSKPYPSISRSIPHRQTEDPTLPLYLYESQKIDERKYYTFLIMGETGSGKTTLLDAFVNKQTGMKFTDNWRWKLADESHLNQKESKVSKTSEISYYYINDSLNIFNMLIIDTPGFGDTRGIHVDDEITKKFKTFFGEIKQIDYVLWTIKSSDTRELSGSLYIYDRIMELFGNNVKDKFIVMCTFADDQIPKCLQVLKGVISYQTYFKFNNSALYIPYQNSSSMTKYYWQMGMSCIDKFISYIQEEKVQPFSLQQSIEVLELRKQIIQLIKKSAYQKIIFQRDFKIAQQNLQQLRKSIQKVYSNTPYKTTVAYEQFRRVPLSNFYQICSICQISCCQACQWPPSSPESKCVHFNPYCPVCPGRCPRSYHIRYNERIEKFTNYREQIIQYKRSEFDFGCSSAQKYMKMLYDNKAAEASANVWQNSLKIKQHIKKLETMALKPKVLGNEQFYKKMIVQQQESNRKGRQERIKKLQQILDNLKYIEKVQKSKRMYDLFPGYEQFQNDYNSLSKQYNGIRP